MKTDTQLQQDVTAELKWEPAVHATQIGVEVKNGVVTLAGEVGKRRAAADAKRIAVDVKGGDVTLTGTVHSWSERDLATRSAWGTAGVRQVIDKMSLVD